MNCAKNGSEGSNSFFDSDEFGVFEFVKPSQAHKDALNSPPTIVSHLSCINLETQAQKQSFFAVQGTLLVQYEVKKHFS